ncbi:hypothetical protein RMCBS344292_04171 [Rhizopus microsporus]|nr:hypothetical protein RMCBS344292_04171 [Rhizopus microsporus]
MDNNPFRNQQTPKDNNYMNSFLYQSQYPPSQQQQQQQQQPNNSLYQNSNYNSNNHPAQQQFQPYQNTSTFPTTTITTTTAMPTPQFSYDVGVSNTSTPAVTSMSSLYGHTDSLTSYSPQYPMMPTPTGYLYQQQHQQQQQQMPYYQQYNTNTHQSSMSNMHIPPNFGLSTTTTNQTYQPRHPPVDASTLLKGTQIRRVECPVCQKMLEGDDMAINHHVNEHYN